MEVWFDKYVYIQVIQHGVFSATWCFDIYIHFEMITTTQVIDISTMYQN